MASRTIDNIVGDDHMQLDKVIDNYFNFDNSSDPNPVTSGNINSLYHDIDTVGLQNLKDYRRNSKFSCMHISIRSLPEFHGTFVQPLQRRRRGLWTSLALLKWVAAHVDR